MVSIVLLNWNSGDFIYECLLSIKQQTCKEWELIIVDNGSERPGLDDLKSFCERMELDAKWECLDVNKGYAIGMNVGLSLAKGAIVIAMNTDVFLPPYFLERLTAFLEKEGIEKLGVVAVPVYRWYYENKELSNRKYSDGSSINIRLSSSSWIQATDDKEILYGSDGSIQIINVIAYREVVKEYGEYYDERFGSYFEDTDSYLKLRSLGYLTKIDKNNRAWHIGSASTVVDGIKKISPSMAIQLHINRWYIFAKLIKIPIVVGLLLLTEDVFRYIPSIGLKPILNNYFTVLKSPPKKYKSFNLKLKRSLRS